MGGKSPRSSGSQTVTQNSEPWSASQPYLKEIMAGTQGLYNSGAGSQRYPGSAVVPFSNQTNAGLNMAEQRAMFGSPVQGAANMNAYQTLSGQNLNNNPYLDAMFNKASGKAAAAVNSQFSGLGRYGSGAHAGVLGDQMNNLATDIYGGNYARERQYQNQMTQLAPTLAQADYNDAQQLMNLGGIREEQAGRQLQDQIDSWNFAQQNPWDRLGQYSGLLSGFGRMGETSTSTQPLYRTGGGGLGGALGGGLMGASLASQFPVTFGLGANAMGATGLASLGAAGPIGLGAMLGLGGLFG